MGEKKKKKKKKKKIKKRNGCSPRNGASLLPPPYNCVGLSPRAPTVARTVHRYRSDIPRRVPTRRLRMGHFRPIGHTGSPHSQPRAGANPRPLGNDGRTRVPPPRTALHLRRNPSGRTSLVQSRGPDLLLRRSGLPRQPVADPRADHPGNPRIPGPAHGSLRRIPPRRRSPRRSRARLALPRAVLRPTWVLRRPRHATRASDQRTQERPPGHASNARHVRPSARYGQRTRLELARTPRRPILCERVRLRDEVRADAPRQARRAAYQTLLWFAPAPSEARLRETGAPSPPSLVAPMPGLATPDARRQLVRSQPCGRTRIRGRATVNPGPAAPRRSDLLRSLRRTHRGT